jgi:FHA domain
MSEAGIQPVLRSEQSIVPTLPIVTGSLACKLVKIDRDVVIVGRNAECGLVFEPKSVSRRQAAIVRRDGDYVPKEIVSMGGALAMVLGNARENAAGHNPLGDITLVACGRN